MNKTKIPCSSSRSCITNVNMYYRAKSSDCKYYNLYNRNEYYDPRDKYCNNLIEYKIPIGSTKYIYMVKYFSPEFIIAHRFYRARIIPNSICDDIFETNNCDQISVNKQSGYYYFDNCGINYRPVIQPDISNGYFRCKSDTPSDNL